MTKLDARSATAPFDGRREPPRTHLAHKVKSMTPDCMVSLSSLFGLVFILMIIPTQTGLADEVWTTDLEKACEIAENENRDMLLLFTGSDWCPPCIKLESQVLSKEEFLKEAQKEFVLVLLDFPQKTPLSAELQKQNDDWAERFGVEGFPTVVLLDQKQVPFAFTGFRDEPPQAYLEHIKQLKQTRVSRDEFIEKANDATGLERANLLDQALSQLDPNIVEVYYNDLVEEIGELDKDDEGGLRTKYFAARDREIRKAVMSDISMVSRLRKPEQAIDFIDKALKEHQLPLEMWLTAQNTKLRLLRRIDKTEESLSLIDEMAAAPDLERDTWQRLIINKAFYLASLQKHEQAFQVLQENIASSPENLLLTIAKGELHDSLGDFDKAIEAYDKAITAAASTPGMLVEVVGAKADSQVELKLIDQALATLDSVCNNESIPARVRAEAMLHKALVMREDGRRRAAILTENKAVEIVEDSNEKGEIQKLVDQFRRKFDSNQ